ncbi:hypothetical protein BC937DRAFT_94777, partial [Endogone sp. FLAS-F59071]
MSSNIPPKKYITVINNKSNTTTINTPHSAVVVDAFVAAQFVATVITLVLATFDPAFIITLSLPGIATLLLLTTYTRGTRDTTITTTTSNTPGMETTSSRYTSGTDPVVQAYASLLSKHCQQHQHHQHHQPVPPAPIPVRSHSTPVLPSSERNACGTLLFDGHPAAFRSPFFAHPLSGYFTPMMMLPVGCWSMASKDLSRIAHEATFGKPQPLFHDQNAWKDAITAEYARMTLHQSQLLEDAAQNKHWTPSPATVDSTNTATITSTTTRPIHTSTHTSTHTSAWSDTKDKPFAIPSPSASYTTTSTSARDDDSTPTGSHSSASPSCTPTSSRSVSPTPHKSRSLRRELRRLRAENADLHARLRITREDLTAERESRLLAYRCHQRSMEQLETEHEEEMDKYLKEIGKEQQEAIKERDDEIARLKQMLVEAQRAGATDEQATIKRRNALWGDIVSTSEDDSGSDQGGRFVGADGGKEVITQRMPIGWCELPPLNEQIETSSDLEEEEEEEEEKTSPECFTVLAGSHIRQALISGLSSAMTNLSLDDLVVKLDPRPDEVARALAAAFIDWAAERIASEQSKQTKVLSEPIKKFWRYVFQSFVRSEDETQALLEGIEQRVGELEHEEQAGAKELARRSEPTETDLRAVTRRFVEYFQRDSSGDEDDDDDDDDEEEEESEEEINSSDEEMQDPAGSCDVCPCFGEDPEGCVCGGSAGQEEGVATQRKEKKSVRFEGESD